MVRPKIEDAKQQYTVMLRPSLVKEIDRIAAIRGRKTRSELIATLIEMGLEEIQALDRLGLLQAAALGDRIWKKLKDAVRRGDIIENKDGKLKFRE